MLKKQLSNLTVRCLILKHTQENSKIVANNKYQDEIDYLVSSKSRQNFIRNLSLKLVRKQYTSLISISRKTW